MFGCVCVFARVRGTPPAGGVWGLRVSLFVLSPPPFQGKWRGGATCPAANNKARSRGLPKFAPCTCSKGPKYSANFWIIKERSRELDGPCKLFVSWVCTTESSTWHTKGLESVWYMGQTLLAKGSYGAWPKCIWMKNVNQLHCTTSWDKLQSCWYLWTCWYTS